MRRFTLLILLSLIVFPLTIFAANKAAPKPAQAPAQQQAAPNVSFVIASPAAQLQKMGNGHYRFVMGNVPPYIRLYTQRPQRSTALANMQNFIASWGVGGNTSFQSVNPNAVIYAAKINGADNTANRFTVGILSNPSYNLARHEFSCDILPLPGQQFLFSKIDYENVLLVIN